MIKKRILSAILATASVTSMCLFSTTSASVDTFNKFNFENLNQISKDSNGINELINTLEQIKLTINNYYETTKDNINIRDYDKVKCYLKLKSSVSNFLQNTIKNNKNINDKNKSIFQTFAKQVFDSIQNPTKSKNVCVDSRFNVTEEDKETLKTIFKNKYDTLCKIKELQAFSNDEIAKKIVNDILTEKKLPFYLKNCFDQKSENDKENSAYINRLIGRINSKKTNTKKTETIFDFSETIQFLIDCLENLKKGELVWSNYFISPRDYNLKLKEQFESFCTENGLLHDNNKNIDNITESISTNEEISAKNIKKEIVKLNQITVSNDVLKHIIVGDDVDNDSTTISIGHTKYAKAAMENIINKNYDKMKSFSNTESLLKFFKASTGFAANEISKKLDQVDNSPVEKWHYSQLGKLSETKKGIFPSEWTWTDIKQAISNILKQNNLKYTKKRKKTDKNSKTIEEFRFAQFHGYYKGIPIQVIVNIDDKSLITAFPMDEKDFTDQYNVEHGSVAYDCADN